MRLSKQRLVAAAILAAATLSPAFALDDTARQPVVVTNVETGVATTYRAGEFIVEMLDTWHQGAAVGPSPVRLVVIDQVEGDVQNTLLRAATP